MWTWDRVGVGGGGAAKYACHTEADGFTLELLQ